MRFIHISISSKELCTSIRLSVCPSRCRNIPLLICIFIQSSIFFCPYVQIDRKSYKTCFCPWFPLLDASLHFCTRVCPSVCPSVRKSVRPYVRPSVCPSIRPSIRPSVRRSICPYVHGSVYSSVSIKEKLRKSPKIIRKMNHIQDTYIYWVSQKKLSFDNFLPYRDYLE